MVCNGKTVIFESWTGVSWCARIGWSKEMLDLARTRERPTYPVPGGTVSQSSQMMR